MPIAAVAGIVAGASALAAGVGTMATISAIGGIVGGIGVLTKSKELTALGAVAGLAGGVGAFAQGQGWLASSDAMDTASNAASASTIDKNLATPSGAEAPNPTNPSSAGAVNGSDFASDQASGLFGADKQTVAQTAGASPTTGLTQDTTDMLAGKSPAQSPSAAVATSPLGQNNPSSAGYTNQMDMASDQASNANYANLGQPRPGSISIGSPTKSTGIFDTLGQFGQWVEKNKQLASIGAYFIGGAFDKSKAAQTNLLNTQNQILQNQLANASAVPNMGFSSSQPAGGSVFRPTAPTYQPVRNGGLFNAR